MTLCAPRKHDRPHCRQPVFWIPSRTDQTVMCLPFIRDCFGAGRCVSLSLGGGTIIEDVEVEAILGGVLFIRAGVDYREVGVDAVGRIGGSGPGVNTSTDARCQRAMCLSASNFGFAVTCSMNQSVSPFQCW